MDNKMVHIESEIYEEIEDISYIGNFAKEESVDPFSMITTLFRS
mgnify:CR=1 FL=1